jgi:hypothetical protein
MWKMPDSQPDEITQVERPEIETETPHPGVSEPRGAKPLISGGDYF